MGFTCPEGQTAPDFLTSLTNPTERIVKPGFEALVPHTPDEFAKRWRQSEERRQLQDQITGFNAEYPFGGEDSRAFHLLRKQEKSRHQRTASPYTLSYYRQILLCMWRQWKDFKANPAVTVFILVVNFVEALIVASIFFNLNQTTSSFFSRGAVLFMLVLLNAFGTDPQSHLRRLSHLLTGRPSVYRLHPRDHHPLRQASDRGEAQEVCANTSQRRGTVIDHHESAFQARQCNSREHHALLHDKSSTCAWTLLFLFARIFRLAHGVSGPLDIFRIHTS